MPMCGKETKRKRACVCMCHESGVCVHLHVCVRAHVCVYVCTCMNCQDSL